MAVILPLLCLAATIFVLLSRYPAWGLPRAFLRACLLVNLYLLLIIELLSLLRAITPLPLMAAWAAATLIALLLGYRSIRNQGHGYSIGLQLQTFGRSDRFTLALVVLIAVAILIVALAVPPNGYEVLHYHMSRVAHWAQNRSVAPYATGVETQNSRPPLSDFAILSLYLLSGGDRFAALPQWFAMLGSLVGVGALTSMLLPKRSAIILAVVYCATLPVGIAQASSPEADYIVAFFAICLACEILTLAQGHRPWMPILFSGIAAGLAIATKPSAIAFVLPLLIFLGLLVNRSISLRAMLLSWVVIAGIALAINSGAFIRNVQLYGSLSDPTEISIHSNGMRNLRGLTSNLLRTMAANAWTPWAQVNDLVYRAVIKGHIMMAMDPSDPATTAHLPFAMRRLNYDSVDGNPLHAFLLLLGVVLSSVRLRRMPRYYPAYLLSVVAGLVFLSLMLKWQVFGNRYSLAFFVLAAPLASVSFDAILPRASYRPLAILLVLSSIPWVFSLKERPLFPKPIHHGRQSVLLRDRQDMYFDSIPSRRGPYVQIADMIRESGCNAVGIAISGAYPAAEYPFWVLLGAPDPNLRIEWLVAGTPSSRFRDADFSPCAVICDNSCPSSGTFGGISQAHLSESVGLFLETP